MIPSVRAKDSEREQSSLPVHGKGFDEELVRNRADELYAYHGMEDGHELETGSARKTSCHRGNHSPAVPDFL